MRESYHSPSICSKLVGCLMGHTFSNWTPSYFDGDDSLTGHAGVPITEKEEAQRASSLPPSGIEIDFPKASGERLRSAVAAVNVAGHRTSLGKREEREGCQRYWKWHCSYIGR